MNDSGQHVTLWQDYWSILTDPGHVLNEVTLNIVFAIIEYFIIRVIWNKLKAVIHTEIDSEHGVAHSPSGVVQVAQNGSQGRDGLSLEQRVYVLERTLDLHRQKEAYDNSGTLLDTTGSARMDLPEVRGGRRANRDRTL